MMEFNSKGDSMNPFKPVTPTVAPGLKFERVPGTQVIKVLN